MFEVQQFLHPQIKTSALDKIVRFCHAARGTPTQSAKMLEQIKVKVIEKIKRLMQKITASSRAVTEDTSVDARESASATAFDDDLLSLFSCSAEPSVAMDVDDGRADEEIQRWLSEPTVAAPCALKFWKQQAENNNYRLLPQVAKVYFGVPSSSAQIERDFGGSGRMMTAHRASLAPHNVDMCSFLCANKAFVDLTQCDRIPQSEIASHIPGHALLELVDEDEYELVMSEAFSGASAEM